MSTVLITGASGFVGKALAAEMARDHTVVGMSRSRPDVDLSYFDEPGNTFASAFDARKIRTELGFVAIDLPGVTLQMS